MRQQLLDQCGQSLAVAFDMKRLALRQNMNVEAVLGDIDTDINTHRFPSLQNRAALFAAQATVRVRWNGGRKTELPTGS